MTIGGDRGSPSLEELRAELRGPLGSALQEGQPPFGIAYLCDPKEVADDPIKLLIRDRDGERIAVVLVSSPADPRLVGRGMRIAAEIKSALGERLGGVILTPLGQGDLRGLSYAILPFRRPLSEGRLARRYRRIALRSAILDWLAEASQVTVAPVPEAAADASFQRPLAHLAGLETMDGRLRRAAGEALDRLTRGSWEPRFVFMHGDLWEGNLLVPARRIARPRALPSPRFVVIDWPGARLRGYGIYDLVCIARSLGVGPRRLRRELSRHARMLGGGPDVAMGHLLASLGHLGLNLGYFDSAKHVETSVSCFETLHRALGGSR